MAELDRRGHFRRTFWWDKIIWCPFQAKEAIWGMWLRRWIFRMQWSPTLLPVRSSLPGLRLGYWIIQKIRIEYLYVPGTVPEGGNSILNKTKSPCSWSWHFSRGKKTISKWICYVQQSWEVGLEGIDAVIHRGPGQPSGRRRHLGRDPNVVREWALWISRKAAQAEGTAGQGPELGTFMEQ